jgi:hypothetical protein
VFGDKAPLRVELHSYAGPDSDQTCTSIKVHVPGAEALSLTHEGALRLDWTRNVREVEVGDPEFDRAFFIQGPVALVRAVMDAPTRSALLKMLQRDAIEVPAGSVYAVDSKVSLWSGVLHARVPDGQGDRQLALLPWILEALLAAAARLLPPADVPARLGSIVRADPEHGVRLECLLMLIRDYADHPATAEALRAGVQDRYDEIRLRAATALGEAGWPTLLDLASGERSSDECSARAVALLGVHLGPDRAHEILASCLASTRTATACACLAALGQWGGRPALETLTGLLTGPDPELAAAAAQALGVSRQPDAERPLVAALKRRESTVFLAVTEALGRMATTRAVMPLREAEQRTDKSLQRAARQAIAEIQARAGGASPGQLSVAGGEVGRLSLPAGEEGNLSVVPELDRPASAGPNSR